MGHGIRRLRSIVALAGVALLVGVACAGPEAATPTLPPGDGPLGLTPTPPPWDSPTPDAPRVRTPTAQPPAPTVTTSPVDLEPLGALPTAPDLDLLDLAYRLAGLRVTPSPPRDPPEVGSHRDFCAVNFERMEVMEVPATLVHVSSHALFYVQDDIAVEQDGVEEAARALERDIYPVVGRFVGREWMPERITILHGRFPQVAGYYSSLDEYPPTLFPCSNDQPMFYINVGSVGIGTTRYLGTLSHELLHAANWRADPSEDTWVNEGLAEVAAMEAGYGASFLEAFFQNSDTSLVHWPADSTATPASYGAATLFARFLLDRYGTDGSLAGLARQPEDGAQGVQAFLDAVAPGTDFHQVFREWALANYLDSRGQPASYPGREVVVWESATLDGSGPVQGAVQQYGADYVAVRPDSASARVTFQGQTSTRLLPLPAPLDGPVWWSNRSDVMDATLTRAFDLRDVESATLELDLWFDLEEEWDYAYVVVSANGGRSWSVVETLHTSEPNAIGQGLAPAGYTGRSGDGESPAWVHDTVDLSPYAGREVLVRLEYVTDAAVSLDGLALRRAAVPETGYLWEGQGDGGWTGDGFVLTPNAVQQTYWVILVELHEDGSVQVRDMALDAQNAGAITLQGFGDSIEQASIIVAAGAPGTAQPAPYTLRLESVAD